jgi:hypothetical protein
MNAVVFRSVQDVGMVKALSVCFFAYANVPAVCNEAAKPLIVLFCAETVRSVSYTHLTLPTK